MEQAGVFFLVWSVVMRKWFPMGSVCARKAIVLGMILRRSAILCRQKEGYETPFSATQTMETIYQSYMKIDERSRAAKPSLEDRVQMYRVFENIRTSAQFMSDLIEAWPKEGEIDISDDEPSSPSSLTSG
jgi:hypothetical protein